MFKKISVLMAAVLLCGAFAESVIRVHFNDGTYRDFPVERLDEISFDANADDPTEPDPKYEPVEEDSNYIKHLDSLSSAAAVASSSAKSVTSSSSKTASLAEGLGGFGNVARWNAKSKVMLIESRNNAKAEVYIFGPQGNCLARKSAVLIPGYNSVYFDDVKLTQSAYIVRVKTSTKDAFLKIQEVK